jgi:hypothetical protein
MLMWEIVAEAVCIYYRNWAQAVYRAVDFPVKVVLDGE